MQLATMLPLTNSERLGRGYEPARWRDRSLHHDVTVTVSYRRAAAAGA